MNIYILHPPDARTQTPTRANVHSTTAFDPDSLESFNHIMGKNFYRSTIHLRGIESDWRTKTSPNVSANIPYSGSRVTEAIIPFVKYVKANTVFINGVTLELAGESWFLMPCAGHVPLHEY